MTTNGDLVVITNPGFVGRCGRGSRQELEQQARYLAYTWGGAIPPRTKEQLAGALEECRVNNPHLGYQRQNDMAIKFARLAGTDPGGRVDSEIEALIEQNAVTGMTFRLVGVDAMAGAVDVIKREAARYGRPPVTDAGIPFTEPPLRRRPG